MPLCARVHGAQLPLCQVHGRPVDESNAACSAVQLVDRSSPVCLAFLTSLLGSPVSVLLLSVLFASNPRSPGFAVWFLPTSLHGGCANLMQVCAGNKQKRPPGELVQLANCHASQMSSWEQGTHEWESARVGS